MFGVMQLQNIVVNQDYELNTCLLNSQVLKLSFEAKMAMACFSNPTPLYDGLSSKIYIWKYQT